MLGALNAFETERGASLDDLGCQTCDFTPSCRTELVGDDTIDTSSQWLLLVVEQDACVVVESDHTTIWPGHLLLGTDNHGVSNVSSSYFLRASLTGDIGDWASLLYDDYNLVACTGTRVTNRRRIGGAVSTWRFEKDMVC